MNNLPPPAEVMKARAVKLLDLLEDIHQKVLIADADLRKRVVDELNNSQWVDE
jgi:hypothetical protein